MDLYIHQELYIQQLEAKIKALEDGLARERDATNRFRVMAEEEAAAARNAHVADLAYQEKVLNAQLAKCKAQRLQWGLGGLGIGIIVGICAD